MRVRASRSSRIAALAAAMLLVAACTGAASAPAAGPSAPAAQAAAAAEPTPSASPSPSPAPSPSLSPSPSASPSPSPPPSASLAATPPPIQPTVRVTWPAAGTARSGPTSGNALAWTSSGAVHADVAVEGTSAASPNLDCAGATWRSGSTLAGQRSPMRIAGVLPGHCYRFSITVRSSTGGVATARSGTLWIEPSWQGGIDLYRSGAFATQQTMDWCVPAAVEMVRNIVDGGSTHSYAEQAAFYRYGRAHGYADYPVPGLDPKAAAALLAHLGQAYGDYRAASVVAMEREAVRQLRRTGKPVILYVHGGLHAWVLDGFTATADPVTSDAFAITSFSVLGPLWPTQRYYDGFYDMPPDTRLSPSSFAAAVGAPYHERTMAVPWEGWFVITEPR